MAVARHVVETNKYLRREGKWKVSWHLTIFLGKDVYGATLGIIGA
ncbi:MAG: hypothetical protein QXM00_12230 [Candidatus Bathyarchaeia archaeon]